MSVMNTLRYLDHFTCAAADCPDDCCHGWEVIIDGENLQVLQAAMAARSPEEAARFAKDVVENPHAARDGESFAASIRIDEAGRCAFLDGDRLCHIYRNYGFDTLSHTCAVYPRHVISINQTLHVAGLLSCPVLARLALFAEDACDRVERPASALPARTLHPGRTILTSSQEHPYKRHLHAIRDAFWATLDRRALSFSDRAFLLLRLGWSLDALYDESKGQPGEEVFFAILAEVPDTPRGKIPPRRIDDKQRAKLLGKFAAALTSKAFWGANPELAPWLERSPKKMVESYEKNRRQWMEVLGDVVDLAMENVVRNHLFTHVHEPRVGLRRYMDEVLLRVAIIRFLLLTHPLLDKGLSRGAKKRLQAAAVAVVGKFSRHFEHRDAYFPGMDDFLEGLYQDPARYGLFLVDL